MVPGMVATGARAAFLEACSRESCSAISWEIKTAYVLQKSLGINQPEEEAVLKDINARLSSNLLPHRDLNGFRKLILVLSKSGGRLGMHCIVVDTENICHTKMVSLRIDSQHPIVHSKARVLKVTVHYSLATYSPLQVCCGRHPSLGLCSLFANLVMPCRQAVRAALWRRAHSLVSDPGQGHPPDPPIPQCLIPRPTARPPNPPARLVSSAEQLPGFKCPHWPGGRAGPAAWHHREGELDFISLDSLPVVRD